MTRSHAVALIVSVFLAVHGALYAYDIHHPDAFLKADRAVIRAEKIALVLDGADVWALQELPRHPVYREDVNELAAHDTLARIAHLGPPGDYLVHGVIMKIGGWRAVILLQSLLTLVACLCVYDIACQLGLRRTTAVVASLVYLLLPTSIAHPHQLVTEGLYAPLVVFFSWGLLRAREGSAPLAAGVAAFSAVVAVAVRPQFLLLPGIMGTVGWVWGWPRPLCRLLVFAPAAALAVWMLFVGWYTGEVGLGNSELGVGYNLYSQVERIARIYRIPFDTEQYPTKQMPVSEYLTFFWSHPGAVLAFRLVENTNLLLNIGVNQLLGQYLDIDAFDTMAGGTLRWHELRGRVGLVEIVRVMASEPVSWLAVFMGSVAGAALLLVLASWGLYVLYRARAISREVKIVMVVVLLYGVIAVQPAILRPGHRSGFDFTLVLLAMLAAETLLRRRKHANHEGEP